jgi:hypothetical protein
MASTSWYVVESFAHRLGFEVAVVEYKNDHGTCYGGVVNARPRAAIPSHHETAGTVEGVELTKRELRGSERGVGEQVDVVDDVDVATLLDECAEAQRSQRRLRLLVWRDAEESSGGSRQRIAPPEDDVVFSGLNSPASAPSSPHDQMGITFSGGRAAPLAPPRWFIREGASASFAAASAFVQLAGRTAVVTRGTGAGVFSLTSPLVF